MNKAILAELARCAKQVFECLDIKPGTYTAYELSQNKDKNGNYLHWEYQGEQKDFKIQVEKFTLWFAPEYVFLNLYKMEKLCRATQKDKARFTREEKRGKPVYSFRMELGKQHKDVCQYADGSSNDRLENVLIDVERNRIVASSGRVLNSCPVSLTDVCGELPDTEQIVLNPKWMKKLTGQSTVSVYKKDEVYVAEISHESGEVYTQATIGWFPKWEKVIPDKGSLNWMSVSNVDNVRKFVTSIVKQVGKSDMPMTLYIETFAGKTEAVLSAEVESKESLCAILLNNPCRFNMKIALRSDLLLKVLTYWNGSMGFVDVDRGVLVGSEYDADILLMPMFSEQSKRIEVVSIEENRIEQKQIEKERVEEKNENKGINQDTMRSQKVFSMIPIKNVGQYDKVPESGMAKSVRNRFKIPSWDISGSTRHIKCRRARDDTILYLHRTGE